MSDDLKWRYKEEWVLYAEPVGTYVIQLTPGGYNTVLYHDNVFHIGTFPTLGIAKSECEKSYKEKT